MAEKIRHRIARCLAGNMPYDDLTKSEKSYMSLFIYKGASSVLASKDRRAALQEVPENLRPLVRKEAIRLIDLRKRNKLK